MQMRIKELEETVEAEREARLRVSYLLTYCSFLFTLCLLLSLRLIKTIIHTDALNWY